MSAREYATFQAGLDVADPWAAWALAQATLRLRREVCWLWRERAQQAGAPDAAGSAGAAGGLPPSVSPALASLDLLRYDAAKQAFFAEDATARYLSERITAVPPPPQAQRGGFGWVVRELQLQEVDVFVLALALLPAVDSAAGAVIACCHNDAQRTEPTLGLAQRLWPAPQAMLALHDPGHPLFTHGLLTSPTSGWDSVLQVPAMVARELLGGAALAAAVTPRLPAASATLATPALRRVIPLLAPAGAPLREQAARMAAQRNLALMVPQAAAVTPERTAAMMTVAWLRGAALLLPAHALRPTDPHGVDAQAPALPLPALPVTVIVALHDRGAIPRLGEGTLPAVALPGATWPQRLAAWQAALPALADNPVLAEAATRLRGEGEDIARIAAELAANGHVPLREEVLAAARADLDLGALAQAVVPRFTLGEVMLPAQQARQLQEIVTAIRNLGRVHHQWGTALAWNEAGLTALFAGPPGTGKTMACEALASALSLPLYRIDLSQVVNKYIGETEKNLKRLFDAADKSDVILLFDEADALFGKRTEVKDAHDRYANLEISYLLERMERFKGLAVLATNRRKDLDEAFLRRLRFVVEFPLPGVEERKRIWQSAIPPGVDGSALDLDFLAQRFPIAGGHIRAIVFQACLQSADDNAPRVLAMPAVVRAVQREYDKLERSSSLDQFGPYAALVETERGLR